MQRRYRDRLDAGEALGRALTGYRGRDTVVLGLPRGGVVVAWKVAEALGCELDVMAAGKLRAPDNPELAIGAVSEDGEATLNMDAIRIFNIPDEYMETEKGRRIEELKKRLSAYRLVKKRVDLRGRTVIIVDDGVATGSTVMAAVHAASASGAGKVVVAVPVGARDALERIESMEGVEGVVCPLVPEDFYSVSQAYEDFTQVEDEEVIRLLGKAA